jgi:DNA repair photolyase
VPSTARRIKALRELREAALETCALVCPAMPFLTEVRMLIDWAQPHADTVWVCALAMQSEDDRNWRNVRSILRESFPELEAKYREIAFDAGHPLGRICARISRN